MSPPVVWTKRLFIDAGPREEMCCKQDRACEFDMSNAVISHVGRA